MFCCYGGSQLFNTCSGNTRSGNTRSRFLVFLPANPSNFSHCKCFSIRIWMYNPAMEGCMAYMYNISIEYWSLQNLCNTPVKTVERCAFLIWNNYVYTLSHIRNAQSSTLLFMCCKDSAVYREFQLIFHSISTSWYKHVPYSGYISRV